MKTEAELIDLLEKYKEELGKYRICHIKLAKSAILDIYSKYDESNPIFINKYHEFLLSIKSNDLFVCTESSYLLHLMPESTFHISYELDEKTAELVWIRKVALFGKCIYSEEYKK